MMMQEDNNLFSEPTLSGGNSQKSGISMDKGKIFWVFVIGILVLSFVFVFGYWIGQNNAKDFSSLAKNVNSSKSLSLENEEIKEILSEDKQDNQVVLNKETSDNKTISAEELFNKEGSVEKPKTNLTHFEKETVNSKQTTVSKNNTGKKQNLAKGSKKYAIQLASFTSEAKASALKEQLLAMGLKGFVTKDGKIYKVRIGNYDSYNQATAVLSKVINKFKINDAFIFVRKTGNA
ncbi:MAG TPA: hypothetical protein DHW82_10220 [Spirochaetia bacterium]|nr:MAG: hypothetical protein A2Y41_14100 [Spirochaetes bacterium GWB1_36_13]HCL57366.1 hypothetical protein [Spirochaetia bacterium]